MVGKLKNNVSIISCYLDQISMYERVEGERERERVGRDKDR